MSMHYFPHTNTYFICQQQLITKLTFSPRNKMKNITFLDRDFVELCNLTMLIISCPVFRSCIYDPILNFSIHVLSLLPLFGFSDCQVLARSANFLCCHLCGFFMTVLSSLLALLSTIYCESKILIVYLSWDVSFFKTVCLGNKLCVILSFGPLTISWLEVIINVYSAYYGTHLNIFPEITSLCFIIHGIWEQVARFSKIIILLFKIFTTTSLNY